MQNKSIITKTLNKIKPINQDKIVLFNNQTNHAKSSTQTLLKAHALVSSKALPLISGILNEENEDKNDNKSNIKTKEDSSLMNNEENNHRRSRNKSSKRIKMTPSCITFSKISLANNNDFLISNSNELFHPKENVYMGQSFKAKKSKTISDFAYCDNNRISDSKQIKAIAIDNFEGNFEDLFCLFEGHNGKEAASFLQKNMRYYFVKAKQLTSDIDNAIKISFYNIDKEMKECNIKSGSTGNIVYIRKENGKLIIYAANVGNTKTILVSFDKIKELSCEHEVNNETENKRLVSNGAMIVNQKLMGHYHLSRSFGDYQLKPFGVKCEPHIQRHVIEDCDLFVIIGSNSLCALIEDNIKTIAESHQTSSHVLKAILHHLSKVNSKELMSCFVLKLQ